MENKNRLLKSGRYCQGAIGNSWIRELKNIDRDAGYYWDILAGILS